MTRGLLAMLLLCAAAARGDPAVPVPDGYRTEDYRSPVPDSVPGAAVLDTAALKSLMDAGQAVLIDVLPAPRRPEAMRPGMPWLPPRHMTLPGSVWWPDVGRGALAADFEQRFRERLAQLAAPGRVVVFFCLADCWMSWNAARRAGSYGVRAAWYPDGADGWAQAGLPLQEARPDLLD